MQPSDDDLYVNAGDSYNTPVGEYYPAPPAERVEEERQERAIKAASYPIMDDLADWWKAMIDGCDDIHNIAMTDMTVNDVKYTRSVSIEAQVLAYQIVKEKLIEKYQLFQNFGKGGEE